MGAYLLEGFECLREGSRELAPSEGWGCQGARVFASHQGDPGAVRSDEFLWNLEAASFCSQLDLLRGAHRLGNNVIATEAEALQRGYRRTFIITPMALGATRRKCVAGHLIAVLERALRLIVQRRANVLDRVDEVQAVGEHLQIGFLRRRRRKHGSCPVKGRRHCERGE